MVRWRRCLNQSENHPRISAKCPDEDNQLHDINPPLSTFHAGHERLMTPQACGKVGLGQPGRFSGVDEGLAQRFMARASDGPGHTPRSFSRQR